MKLFIALFFILVFVAGAHAQIKVDSNYTVLAAGIDDKLNQIPFILGNFHNIVIKENSSGKICGLVSMKLTFVINSETFHANDIAEAQPFLNRIKPKDVILIEKIKLTEGCFAPPKQIVITIM